MEKTMAKKTDPDAIWKFENTAYTAVGVSQMNDFQLLDLHNKLAKYLGEEERTSLPSRKMLESRTTGMLIKCQHPDVKKAPASEKPAKKAKAAIPADGENESKEHTMVAKSKKSAKSADRRKATPSKERKARMNFEGKKFNAKSKENARREGSSRFKSLAIVISNPGITYEGYIKKGGEHGDLIANINKGYVTMK